jgi:hypothetical protein
LELILLAEAEPTRGQVGGHPLPAAVGAQLPRVGLVEEGPVQEAGHPSLQARVGQRHHHLHPAVEIPFHQVG